jgi:DNA-binding response OmpR family regulator
VKPVRSLLIIEDDDDTRDSLCDFFVAHGFVVYCAEDGRRALALLDRLREPPGCILLDLDMPVMDGHEFMARLRRRSGVPAVIILTGEDDEPPPGARYHFTKPPYLETLLRAVVSCSLR